MIVRQKNLMIYYFNQNTIERWTKGCIFPVPKKGEFRITKNYRAIILTYIAAKVNNALLLNCIEPEWNSENTKKKSKQFS